MSIAQGGSGASEPEVLASTKQMLFPEDTQGAYAVTDTQFATQEWRAGRRIDDRIHEILTPFNHVQLGTGYPDLVGVGHLSERFVSGAADSTDTPPLIAVEAKGYAQDGVDLDRGITQAHNRLADANAAYLTAPANAITPAARTLARDLNVGILAVEDDNDLTVLEAPRIIGSQAPDAASAIRFQATAQGVADQSFGLNHPKNYLAYPLALAHSGSTETLMTDHVVGAVQSARDGAAFLGLIHSTPDGPVLTNLGREVVRFALDLEGDLDSALARFEDWQRSRDRFVDIAGEWGTLARWVVYSYPATERLVEALQRLHDEGTTAPTLREFILDLFETHPAFAVELFVRGTDDARERVFADETTLDADALADGSVYASPTVFQLKAMLYHAGILTERGAEPTRLDPTADVWRLRQPL